MNFSAPNATETVSADSVGMKTDVKIWIYGGAVIFLVGTIGNVLSAIVMMRKPLRKTTTSLYLTVLAFTDLTVLYTSLLMECLQYGFGISAREVSQKACRAYYFWMFWLIHCEAWILVLVAIERFVATFVPVVYKNWFTKKFVVIQLVIMALIFAILDVGLTWKYELSENSGCIIQDTRAYAMIGYIDLPFASMIPALIMFICNIFIAVKLAYYRFNKGPNSDQSRSNIRYMTVVLMTVTAVFLVTSLPMTLFIYKAPVLYANAKTAEEIAQIDERFAGLFILYYVNYTVNFFMYILSGRRFRQELKKMICPSYVKVHPVSSTGGSLQ